MGYRTTIGNINSIGHLIEGNVITFIQQSVSSSNALESNLYLLEGLVNLNQIYMSDEYRNSYRIRSEEYYLKDEWPRIRKELYRIENADQDKQRDLIIKNDKLLSFFQKISAIFSICPVKALLLPGFNQNSINRILTDKKVLDKIVRIHPGETSLVIQFEEPFNKKDIAVLNVFPHFEKALNQVDNWPGVLLWNNDDSLFYPINTERELYDLFMVIRYENNYFNYLRQVLANRRKHQNFAYLFHLSDLHFGNELAEKRIMRIVKILEKHINDLEDTSFVIPIITGDLMDSPSESNKQTYLQFSELLTSKGFKWPIHILGNHDCDKKGILRISAKEKAIISSLTSSKIQIIEELKLAVIKFNSNISGNLARGMIGQSQLMEIGNQLDKLKNIDSYMLIAILHHHPKPIASPEWYDREWYESFLGNWITEKAQELKDAEIFLEWLEARGIKLVLHGHKHIPNIQNYKNISIIAAGSSSGSVKHKENGKTFLSYNVIKYDIDNKKPISCSLYAEDIIGAGIKNILIRTI